MTMSDDEERAYYYRTSAGTFWIRPQPPKPGRVWLGVDETPLGSYDTAEEAAADFANQRTGWSRWDRLEHPKAPDGLRDWQRGYPSR